MLPSFLPTAFNEHVGEAGASRMRRLATASSCFRHGMTGSQQASTQGQQADKQQRSASKPLLQ